MDNEIPKDSTIEIQMLSNDELDIYYTIDGTDPKYGIKYNKELILDDSATVAARTRFFFGWSDVVKSNYTVIMEEDNKAEVVNGTNDEQGMKYALTSTPIPTAVPTPTAIPTVTSTPTPTLEIENFEKESNVSFKHCKYRPVRARCTEYQCIPSASSVHAFRKAEQSFDLLDYERSYLKNCVNGAFMPPKVMPLTQILRYEKHFVVVLCSPEQMHSLTVQYALFHRYLQTSKKDDDRNLWEVSIAFQNYVSNQILKK